MPTCTPVFGVGVRHVQYLLFAVMVSLDFWLQATTFDVLLTRISEKGDLKDDGFTAEVFTEDVAMATKVSVFITFTFGRLLSGFLVTKFTNKYTLVVLILIESIMALGYFWFLSYLKRYQFILCPSLIAFCRSFHWTYLLNILAKWMPPTEITTAMAIIEEVRDGGTSVLTMLNEFQKVIIHYISTCIYTMFNLLTVVLRDGGTSVFTFYLRGLSYNATKYLLLVVTFMYLIWIVVFVLFGADGPDTSYLLSKHELNFLGRYVGPRKRLKCNSKTPWKQIFGTWFMYGWMIADFGRECAVTTYNDALRVVMKGQAERSVFGFQCCTTLVCVGVLVVSIYSDRLLMKEKVNPSQVRKVYSSVGCCGVSICMILAAYVSSSDSKLMFLILCTLFGTIMACGQPICLFDLSPNYTAPLFAMFSFFRMILFVLKEFLDLFIIRRQSVNAAVDGMFDAFLYRYAFLVFIANLLFLMSGDIELKPFDKVDTKDWRKESIISYP